MEGLKGFAELDLRSVPQDEFSVEESAERLRAPKGTNARQLIHRGPLALRVRDRCRGAPITFPRDLDDFVSSTELAPAAARRLNSVPASSV